MNTKPKNPLKATKEYKRKIDLIQHRIKRLIDKKVGKGEREEYSKLIDYYESEKLKLKQNPYYIPVISKDQKNRKAVIRISKTTNRSKKYPSAREAARQNDMTYQKVWKLLNGKIDRRGQEKYIWKYA
jgi:ATP-dependent 26S proteasome regulatory subunit